MPPMCKYVRIRGQHVRGRGRQSSVPVRHVFARIFARIPRIWGHVFCDSNPRIAQLEGREVDEMVAELQAQIPRADLQGEGAVV